LLFEEGLLRSGEGITPTPFIAIVRDGKVEVGYLGLLLFGHATELGEGCVHSSLLPELDDEMHGDIAYAEGEAKPKSNTYNN